MAHLSFDEQSQTLHALAASSFRPAFPHAGAHRKRLRQLLLTQAWARASNKPHRQPWVIGFCTDIEGDLDYFHRYVAESDVLDLDADDGDLLLRPGCCFVFGGDLFDKGPGDLELARLLVKLKKTYPRRVFLLMGNRDVNKLRFTSELTPWKHAAPPPVGPFDKLGRETAGGPCSSSSSSSSGGTPLFHSLVCWRHTPVADWLREHTLPVSRTAHCKWMLEQTLGCSRTFEFRRAELASIRRRRRLRRRRAGDGDAKEAGAASAPAVTDDEVVQSFLDAAMPGGAYYEYLRLAQVGVVLGRSLFVHGTVPLAGLGFVPSQQLQYTIAPSAAGVAGSRMPAGATTFVVAWIDALNAFARRALDLYDANPYWQPDGRTRGGGALIHYQSSPATFRQGVIVESCLAKGVLSHVPPDVVATLRRCGVCRLLSGHKPSGECPNVDADTGQGQGQGQGRFEQVVSDTSRSDDAAPDRRGIAVAETSIRGSGSLAGVSSLCVHGVLKDGRRHAYRLPPVGLDNATTAPLSADAVAALEAMRESARGDDDVRGGGAWWDAAGGEKEEDEEEDPLVGTQDDDGFWIKTRLCGDGGRDGDGDGDDSRRSKYFLVRSKGQRQFESKTVALERKKRRRGGGGGGE